MRKHGIKIKLRKCQFMMAETKYLGFVINKKGIKPDDDKVELIRWMPESKTVRQVRGFIEAIGYYRRFISAFSRIATPLIALTKKDTRFKWTDDRQRSFDTLKNQLTTLCNGYRLKEMDTATRVQILDETDCISHSTNTLGKCMNPNILPPAMDK